MAKEKKKEQPKETKFSDVGLRGFTLYDKDGNPVQPVEKNTPKK